MNRRSFFTRLASAAVGVALASSVEVFGWVENNLPAQAATIDMTAFKEWFIHWNSSPEEVPNSEYLARQKELEAAIDLEYMVLSPPKV